MPVIEVIEVRRAANGYVVSAFFGGSRFNANVNCKGYATYVSESVDPSEIGRVVAKVLRDHQITAEVVIPPARAVPGDE